jgi:hypothetical protein
MSTTAVCHDFIRSALMLAWAALTAHAIAASIEPRLYLLTRMIMDVALGKER